MATTYSSVKTIFGLIIDASRRPGTTYTPLAYSTLNEYHSVQSDAVIPEGSTAENKYFAIGRGGHRNVAGSTGDNLTDILQHRINDAALFEQIPFLMREVGNDIDATTRAKYRIRKLVEYDSVQYWAYFLKVVTSTTESTTVTKLTISDGDTTSTEYVPAATQLEATAVSMSNGVVNTASGEHIKVSSPFQVTLTTSDLDEIRNCVDIIYGGDQRYGVISECAVVGGVDQEVTVTGPDSTITHTEAVGAAVYNHIGCNVPLIQQTEDLNFNFSIGTTLKYLT